MRKCKFLENIKWDDGKWSQIESEGVFHQWGCSFEEFETGPGNITVGIIETSDGKIHTPIAEYVTFLDKKEQ